MHFLSGDICGVKLKSSVLRLHFEIFPQNAASLLKWVQTRVEQFSAFRIRILHIAYSVWLESGGTFSYKHECECSKIIISFEMLSCQFGRSSCFAHNYVPSAFPSPSPPPTLLIRFPSHTCFLIRNNIFPPFCIYLLLFLPSPFPSPLTFSPPSLSIPISLTFPPPPLSIPPLFLHFPHPPLSIPLLLLHFLLLLPSLFPLPSYIFPPPPLSIPLPLLHFTPPFLPILYLSFSFPHPFFAFSTSSSLLSHLRLSPLFPFLLASFDVIVVHMYLYLYIIGS